MPSFSRLLLIPALLAAYTGSTLAVEAIPASCLKCRKAKDDAAFITCLYDCMADLASVGKPAPEPGPKPVTPQKPQADTQGALPNIPGWHLKMRPDAPEGKALRTAECPSDAVLTSFFDRIRPVLVLAKEKGEPVKLFVDVNPGVVEGFSDRVLVQIDDGDTMALPLRTVWNGHAVRLDSPTLLKDMRRGKRLYVRLDIFGMLTQTFDFDLTEIKRVTRWLDEADARRS